MKFKPFSSSVFALFLIIQCNSKSASEKPFTDIIATRFPSIIEKFLAYNLQRCSSFLLHDIAHFNSTPSSIFDAINFSVMQNSGGTIIAQADKNLSSPLFTSLAELVDVFKMQKKCTFGIIYVSDNSTLDSLPSWYKFLQNSHGVIKTDEDRFLFISKSKAVLNYMLTSAEFGIRFKFAATLEENFEASEEYSVNSYCYFCKPAQHQTMLLNEGSLSKIFIDRTRNFHGKVVTISTPTSTRWLNEMHTVGDIWIPKRGIYSLVLDQVMIKCNFSAEYYPSTGGGTGGIVNKTKWVGTVGDVLYGKAEMGHVTALTLQRSKVVDTSFPITYEWLTFTTGKAEEYHSWKTVYWPFTTFIWELTGVTCLLVGFLFKIVLKVTRQRSFNYKIFEYMLGVIMEEGVPSPEQFPTHSLRITMVVWLIFGLIMGTAYKSKLTAFLAFPHVENLPQTFDELSQSHYSVALQYIKGAAYQILKSSTNPTYISIFKRMELEESDVKCFKRTMSSDFACISWDSLADYVYHKNLTDKYGHAPVVKAPALTAFITAGLVMPKRSILKASIDRVLVWSLDTGMMSKWRQLDNDYVATQRRHWEKETNQPEIDYTPSRNTALSFSHLSGGYYVFCLGIILSVVGFLAEKMFSHYKECVNINIGETSSVEKIIIKDSNK